MDFKNLLGGPGMVTLTGLDGRPIQVTHDQLAQMDHASLLGLRKMNQDPNAQDLLSGYEHRSVAREAGSSNPLMGLSYGAAAPMYQLMKSIPMGVTGLKSRSSPSLNQLGQGIIGAGEGVVEGVKNWMK